MNDAIHLSMRTLVPLLETPVMFALLLAAAWSLFEVGACAGERAGGLSRMRRDASLDVASRAARRRIDRADLLTRIGPSLGLMGTLIPLGPGLAALGRGEMELLASAVTVAFDTTVVGLFVGVVGFAIGRLRRRWYDALLDQLEASDAGA